MEQCHLFKLHMDVPVIVTNCGGNVAKTFNTTLQRDWLRYGCHLLHNVVKAALDTLKNNTANPTQATAALLQEALYKSMLLFFIALLHKIICLLCHMNLCVMSCIPKCNLRIFFYFFSKFFGQCNFASYMGQCTQIWFPTFTSMFLHPVFF